MHQEVEKRGEDMSWKNIRRKFERQSKPEIETSFSY